MRRVVKALLVGSIVLGMGGGATLAGDRDPVKIGVMTDMSGVFKDYQGEGAVLGARMAMEDFGGKVLGQPIELLSIDDQNKPDLSSATAREWIERDGVDMILGVENSAVALAVMKVAKARDRITIVTGGAAMAITNEDCNDRTINWSFDSYALAHGTAAALVEQGGDSWFFINADYAYGKSMRQVASQFVEAGGGKVLGGVGHPIGALDYASFLLQAQASGAKIIGIANAGLDTVNVIKQAAEFGVTPKQKLAALSIFIPDIHSLGLKTAGGIFLTTSYYWDRTEETRAWSKRFFERQRAMPSMVQAANYSAVMHYLNAVKKTGTKDAATVMAAMKAAPVNDFFANEGLIRDDGRMIHDMYLMQVKTPEESKYPWDYYRLIKTIPRDEAFQPLKVSACPLVKK
jgi:branched-chain amino acid transport system substrate-binding protein